MNVKRIDCPNTQPFSPDDWIKLLFEQTSNGNMVDIPVFYDVNSNDFYRCQIDWDMQKYETLLKKYSEHYAAIERISSFGDRYSSIDAVNKELHNSKLVDFWKTYIRPFESKDVEEENISNLQAESEKRIGKHFCSYDLIIRSMRLCRLLNLKAPESIVLNEARELATAMLIYEYGISCEKVSEH